MRTSAKTKDLLGMNLRRFRQARKLTQHELADICNFERSYIGDVERGQHNVTLASLERLAEGLGLLDCPGILLLSEEDIQLLLSRPRGRAAASATKGGPDKRQR